MEEIKLEDLFIAAAEDNSATLLETLVHKLEKENINEEDISDNIQFLLESWSSDVSGARASCCLALAEMGYADTPMFRKALGDAIKNLLPPFLNKTGFVRALGLRENSIAPQAIACRYRNMVKLKNGIIVYLSNSSRWGTVTNIDGFAGSVAITALSGGGSYAAPLPIVLSEVKMFTAGSDTLKLSGFDRKSNFSASDYRELAARKAINPLNDEEIKIMAHNSLVPEVMGGNDFEAWWSRNGTAAVSGGKRKSSEGRSIQEMHILLSEKTSAGFFEESSIAGFVSFFTKLKSEAAQRESVMLAESLSMIASGVSEDGLRRIVEPLRNKAPFWPLTLNNLSFESLNMWGEVPARHMENLSRATMLLFPPEYLAQYALLLPLRCLNVFCAITDDHLLTEAVKKTKPCSCDILLWIWKNRNAHSDELNKEVNFINTVLALSVENLPKHWTSSQRELRRHLLDKPEFQKMLIENARNDVGAITSALQKACFFMPGEQQSLLVKLARLSKEIRDHLENGAGHKLLAAEKRETHQPVQHSGPIITSIRSHRQMLNELHDIINVHMPENRESLKAARAHGDFRENAEFDAAKERRNFLSRRRSEIERDILNAQPVDFRIVSLDGSVIIGSTVKVQHESGNDEVFYLVGAWDGNPEKNWISYKTRLGETLLGKTPAEKVLLPNGASCIIKEISALPENIAKYLAEG
jgi:transcription elongation GreA/GreB family factor